MTIDWNLVLKIWAVVGPLVAASASAIWSRRMQIQDRAHENARLSQARKESLEDRDLEFKRNALHSHKNELRACLSEFIASCNEYVMSCVDFASDPKDARVSKQLGLARSAMNRTFYAVAVLCNDELAAAASKLLNLAAETPISGDELDQKFQEHSTKYQTAKNDLTRSSRKLLGIQNGA